MQSSRLARAAVARAARLRDVGLRATAPRLSILGALERDRSHPTAERLHGKLRKTHPSLSLSTVYDVLETFIRVGLCRRVPSSGGRLRVDGTVQDHDHAICRSCGTIFDVRGRAAVVGKVPRRLPEGLEVSGVRVEYDVTCSACRAGERR